MSNDNANLDTLIAELRKPMTPREDPFTEMERRLTGALDALELARRQRTEVMWSSDYYEESDETDMDEALAKRLRGEG